MRPMSCAIIVVSLAGLKDIITSARGQSHPVVRLDLNSTTRTLSTSRRRNWAIFSSALAIVPVSSGEVMTATSSRRSG